MNVARSSQQNPLLLDLAQKVSDLTSQFHSFLESTSQLQPQFSPTSADISTNSEVEALRASLNDAAADLLLLINGPKATLRYRLGTIYDLAAYQVAHEFRFFNHIPTGGRATIHDVAQASGLQWDIVARVLRSLATQRVFCEVETGTFQHTTLSSVIAQDEDLEALFHMQLDDGLRAVSETATCLSKVPSTELNGMECPFYARFGSSIFEYYKNNPEKGVRFGRAMTGSMQLDRKLTALRDDYDWANLKPGTVVDVGGAGGSAAITLAQRFLHLDFIVQDISKDLLDLGQRQVPHDIVDRISFQESDFFEPQQITDASAFFIRGCLHNWPDAECVRVLKAFVPALEHCQDGTPLLINDTIMPAPNEQTRFEEQLHRQSDMAMLVLLGSAQRNEEDYRRLLAQADNRLKIVKVKSTTPSALGLLEVHLMK